MLFLLYKNSTTQKNIHFQVRHPFQLHLPCKNTPVCKFAENGKKVKPANFFCILGPLLSPVTTLTPNVQWPTQGPSRPEKTKKLFAAFLGCNE